MSFLPDPPRPRRKPSLTPMIDVVFLLLVFFMLASRFGMDAVVPLPLTSGAGQTAYEGPPRLVDILPEGVRVNGVAVAEDGLARALEPLMTGPEDIVILRGRDGATLQRVVSVNDALQAAGIRKIVLVE
ncbi:biopolymer transporter ExbD [Aquicoccus sp. SCR17]|nr:biopolymer transporter ExbD [Carideicomes alvinocaridis]